jgi:corticosteroid 11-beta-dehydrogenase isozyme 1
MYYKLLNLPGQVVSSMRLLWPPTKAEYKPETRLETWESRAEGEAVSTMHWFKACLSIVLLPVFFSIVPLNHFYPFDPSTVQGQRVLICGASGGIGEEMVYKYARLGAHVAIVARRPAQLERVAQEALVQGAASVLVAVGDMASEDSILAVMNKVLADGNWHGEMDVLLLNHAYQQWGWLLPSATDIYAADLGTSIKGRKDDPSGFKYIDASVMVNFVSFIKLAVAAVPSLSRGGRASGTHSHIIVISSGGGKMAVPKQSVYGGTKHALHGFFDSFRLELEAKDLPISTTVVVLGQVGTDTYNQGAGMDMSMPTMAPKEAAHSIVVGGMSGIQELYVPLNQFLHVVTVFRPLYGMRYLLDRLTLKLMGV